ncbi:MAG: YCF48-related protein [Opitutus sp.]
MFHRGCGGAGSTAHPNPAPVGLRIPTAWISAAVFLCAASFAAGDVAPTMLLLDGVRAGTEIIAVGERGTILRSTDNAGSWRPAENPGKAPLTAISLAPNGSRGWAVGHDAVILVTEDAGRSWALQWQGETLEDSFLDVLALDDTRVIAVGAYGMVLHSSDAGKSWNRRRIDGDDFHLNRISRGPTGTLYVAGERGTLLRSRDAGTTWAPIRSSYDGSFFGILPLDRQTLVAYGLRGHVYRSADDGDTWVQVEIPHPVLLATAIRLKNGDILIAGHARALLVSRDLGRTFAPVPTAMMTAIAELLELPDGGVLALGEAGATVLSHP